MVIGIMIVVDVVLDLGDAIFVVIVELESV